MACWLEPLSSAKRKKDEQHNPGISEKHERRTAGKNRFDEIGKQFPLLALLFLFCPPIRFLMFEEGQGVVVKDNATEHVGHQGRFLLQQLISYNLTSFEVSGAPQRIQGPRTILRTSQRDVTSL